MSIYGFVVLLEMTLADDTETPIRLLACNICGDCCVLCVSAIKASHFGLVHGSVKSVSEKGE